jgi:hypothetical protein
MSESCCGVALAACMMGAIGCGSVEDQPIDASPGPGIDAAVDALPDSAAGGVKYDVGYVNEITVQVSDSGAISGFTLVVNKGTAPLDLSTALVVAVSDDNPAFTWSFEKVGNSIAMLSPERSAGLLNQLATTQIVTNGLVPEPIEDQILNFGMFVTPAPTAGLNLQTQAVLQIGTANIVLPFTVHYISGSTAVNSTRRISSQP